MGIGPEFFLPYLKLLDDGFVARAESSGWRLGSVLLARRNGDVALIQKAASGTDAYEFTDLWALPGGMIRAHEGDSSGADIPQLTRRSLQRRVALEAGIGPDISDAMTLVATLGPIVTSYTAKGRQRYTLMVVHSCQCPPGHQLVSGDRSVQAARWAERPDWARLAPANCLILGHLLWGDLTEQARAEARPSLEAAAAACGQWAADVGVQAPPRPWDDAASLESWLAGFPD